MTLYCNRELVARLDGQIVLLADVLGGYFHQDAYCADIGHASCPPQTFSATFIPRGSNTNAGSWFPN
jgi:hypothetical protein